MLVEIRRVDRMRQALAGRVVAHSPDEDEITRLTIRAREERPEAHLWAFYTGDRIAKGMILILACL